LPNCVTCIDQIDCDNDNFTNGNLEMGLNCSNDANDGLPSCDCADIPIDLELYQYSVSPSTIDCNGNDTNTGSITFIPPYGSLSNCGVNLCEPAGNCILFHSDEIVFPNKTSGDYSYQLVYGTEVLTLDITIPSKATKQIEANYQIVNDTKNSNCVPNCQGSITVNYTLETGEYIIWTCTNHPNTNTVNCNSCHCDNVPTVQTQSTQLTGLCPGTYSYTIFNADDICIYSGNTGVSAGGTPAQIDQERLSIYPSVFSNQTNVEIELPQSEDVILRVYDAQGNPIEDLLNGQTLNQGITNVPFNANGDPSGVYIFQLQTISACPTIKGQIGIKH